MTDLKQPVFIVGAQRSGSTLLRLILNSHSQLAIPEEARFLMPLLKWDYLRYPLSGDCLRSVVEYISLMPQFKLWNYDNSAFIREVSSRDSITLRDLVDEMYGSYARSEGKKYWGDKSLFFRNIDILHALFPEARFIHIVRDGRDVFDSWRKIDPTKGNVTVTALDWCYKLHRIKRSFLRLPPAKRMTVRYEDLLDEPERIAQLLCSFIGLEYEESMLDFYRTSHKYIGTHHSELIFQPLNKSNVTKWKKSLTTRESETFTLLAGRLLREYGYEVPGLSSGLSGCLLVLSELCRGLPEKVFEVIRIKRLLDQAVRRGEQFETRLFDTLPIGKMPGTRRTGGIGIASEAGRKIS